MDTRWTKQHGKSHLGYKNHISIDRKHKLVRGKHGAGYCKTMPGAVFPLKRMKERHRLERTSSCSQKFNAHYSTCCLTNLA
jgi:hypothetical protein